MGRSYRDWWPMIAGSTTHALLLWQRFVDGQQVVKLMYAIYNPDNGEFVKGVAAVESGVKYYTYDVQYIASIDRFLVTGAYKNGAGFAFLIDDNGQVTAKNKNLPGLVREAQPAIKAFDDGAFVVYPRHPNGLFVLKIGASSIALNNVVSDSYAWRYMGTDGIFTGENAVYFVSLSETGNVEKMFNNIVSTSRVKDDKASVNTPFRLYPGVPNPFNPKTTIRYDLSRDAPINLSVYDISGRHIVTLTDGVQPAGSHVVHFDGNDLPSGVYCCTMISHIFHQTTKLLLVK